MKEQNTKALWVYLGLLFAVSWLSGGHIVWARYVCFDWVCSWSSCVSGVDTGAEAQSIVFFMVVFLGLLSCAGGKATWAEGGLHTFILIWFFLGRPIVLGWTGVGQDIFLWSCSRVLLVVTWFGWVHQQLLYVASDCVSGPALEDCESGVAKDIALGRRTGHNSPWLCFLACSWSSCGSGESRSRYVFSPIVFVATRPEILWILIVFGEWWRKIPIFVILYPGPVVGRFVAVGRSQRVSCTRLPWLGLLFVV